MTTVVKQWGDLVVASLVIVPLSVVAVPLLAAWRLRRGVPRWLAWRRSLAEAGMVAGTLPWLWVVFSPGPGPRQVHVIPLRDLVGQVGEGVDFVTVQVLGNLLVFAALGFFAPVRFAALAGSLRVFGLAAACSAVIEILQYHLDLNRVSSVDDVWVNALGAVLAAQVSRRFWATRSRAAERVRAGSSGESSSTVRYRCGRRSGSTVVDRFGTKSREAD
ncbi:MAG TPA: VanZ family protein [Micromonospora sp.]